MLIMKGQYVKEKLLKNGYKLKEVADSIGYNTTKIFNRYYLQKMSNRVCWNLSQTQ